MWKIGKKTYVYFCFRERESLVLSERNLGPIHQLHVLQGAGPLRGVGAWDHNHNLLRRLHCELDWLVSRRLHILQVQVSRNGAEKISWRSWISLKNNQSDETTAPLTLRGSPTHPQKCVHWFLSFFGRGPSYGRVRSGNFSIMLRSNLPLKDPVPPWCALKTPNFEWT